MVVVVVTFVFQREGGRFGVEKESREGRGARRHRRRRSEAWPRAQEAWMDGCKIIGCFLYLPLVGKSLFSNHSPTKGIMPSPCTCWRDRTGGG